MTDSPFPYPENESDFIRELSKIEERLQSLKQRYQQIQQAQHQQAELQQEVIRLGEEWQKTQLPELEQELAQITEQIQESSLVLESELLSNEDLMRLYKAELRSGLLGEIFWQIVRFGGLGVIIGWLLKTASS